MEFTKHLSKEKLENFNPNKCYAITEKQLETIWRKVILSNESTLIDIRLIQAEDILNAIFYKAVKITDEKKKAENIEKIDELKNILSESKDILKVNRVQSKIINQASFNNYALKQEVIKLNKVINSLK